MKNGQMQGCKCSVYNDTICCRMHNYLACNPGTEAVRIEFNGSL